MLNNKVKAEIAWELIANFFQEYENKEIVKIRNGNEHLNSLQNLSMLTRGQILLKEMLPQLTELQIEQIGNFFYYQYEVQEALIKGLVEIGLIEIRL